jgi:hypothetical protein
MQALTQGNPVADVSLTGNVTWTAGSDPQTGTATLSAKGTAESRLDLTLASGNRTEVRNSSSGTPLGNWFGADGAVNEMAQHNCWSDGVWFFPSLSSLALSSSTGLIFVNVGQETRNGISVQHISVYQYPSGQNSNGAALIQSLSTEDFYLDSTSLLPVAVTFNTHPDNDATTNLGVEVDFSNYQSVNGFQVPYRIQKYFQGDPLLDFTVTSATINSGLSDNIFTIQ